MASKDSGMLGDSNFVYYKKFTESPFRMKSQTEKSGNAKSILYVNSTSAVESVAGCCPASVRPIMTGPVRFGK